MRYTLKLTAISAILVALFTIGCSSTSKPPTSSSDPSSTSELAALLLKKAQSSPSGAAEQYYIDAADLFLGNEQAEESLAAISHINYATLPLALKYRYLLIFAKAHVSLEDPEQALEALSGSRFNISALASSLSIEEQLTVDQLRAHAYDKANRHFEAARERIFFSGLLSTEDLRLNEEKIWAGLQRIALTALQDTPQQQASLELNGWIQLAILAKSNTYDIDAQLRSLSIWLESWPSHPAAQNLPPRLSIMSNLHEFRPKHIALLLPLSGQFSAHAGAIRNGFLANYYLSQSRNNPTPILHIYNTESSDKSFMEVYIEASSSGADLIIGPLKKENVAQLETIESLPVPTLSLNYGPEARVANNPNLTEFGLSPEDETLQIALKAFSDGHDKAAILYPDNSWGYRLAQSFSEQWQAIGGEVLTQEGFPVKNNYGPSLKALLNIPESESRATRIKQTLNEPIKFTARRRKDIDFIAMLALPNQAKQLKPGLAFYFAADIPLYSTSHIHSTVPTHYKNNNDLNGIQFCDIPWILEPHSDVQKELDSAWSKRNQRSERLYALGADAFHLSAWLPIMKKAPSIWIVGQTGRLQLLSNQRIQRALPWAIMKNGKASDISPPLLNEL
ncbi:MAG: penicillin-binding protein activator [Pseudomonadales bacterium]|nr:penicillin-binding protein activator [Pseudomonadales bacterium]